MPTKPKVHIDQDGDGTTDVSVDVDTPEAPDPTDPDHMGHNVRTALTVLVSRMEVTLPPGTQRVTYSAARETIRGLLS